MSRRPINHSPDLRRLREEGYDINVLGGYLIIRDVPYLNSSREVKKGTIVSTLRLAGDIAQRPDSHQVHFSGELPCHADGSPMSEIVSSSGTTRLDEGLMVDHSFSQKPARGYYENYHEKIATYCAMLVSQARAIDPGASAQTCRVEPPQEEDNSPFNYLDTASSRAEINVVTRKLMLGRVAIIGLGGTGAYVLDLVSKTPVKEIHVFDQDKFSTHNAFRSPGAASVEELREQPSKTEYFKDRYSKLHNGIVAHELYIHSTNVDLLDAMDFVFLCIDRASAKGPIVAKLSASGTPFVDVGLGVYVKGSSIGGVVRLTGSSANKTDHIADRIAMQSIDDQGEYDSNIQIADLNALNAALAVIWWKKQFGFYADLEREHFSAYAIESNLLISEDSA